MPSTPGLHSGGKSLYVYVRDPNWTRQSSQRAHFSWSTVRCYSAWVLVAIQTEWKSIWDVVKISSHFVTLLLRSKWGVPYWICSQTLLHPNNGWYIPGTWYESFKTHPSAGGQRRASCSYCTFLSILIRVSHACVHCAKNASENSQEIAIRIRLIAVCLSRAWGTASADVQVRYYHYVYSYIHVIACMTFPPDIRPSYYYPRLRPTSRS